MEIRDFVGACARRAAVLAVVCVAARAAHAQQQVLSFDVPAAQLPALQAALLAGTPVNGVAFDPASSWSVGDFTDDPAIHGQLQCHSAPNCASPNGYDGARNLGMGLFRFVTPERFYGAWVSGPPTLAAFGDPSANPLFWELLSGGQVVYTSPVFTPTAAPAFYSIPYAGAVDAVRILGPNGLLVLDDITYGSAATTAPEPTTVTLVGVGVLAAAGVARRRTTRTTRA